MASADTEMADPKPKTQTKIRKRAPKACLSCRARKVRCDVSQRGRPCMNCYLDSETCVVTGRASRFRRVQREGAENVQVAYPPYVAENEAPKQSAETVVKSRLEGQPVPSVDDEVPSQDQDDGHDHAECEAESSTANAHHHRSPEARSQENRQQNAARPSETFNPPPLSTSYNVPLNNSMSFGNTPPQFAGEQRMRLNSDITYSYYPFITISNLPHILPQDVNFLELQGCLRIPTRSILDEFVQQYFLHVHPMLPMLNEGDFWDMYCNNSAEFAPTEKLSLLVLQSMMFASCNFVSRASIKALGFPTIRAARATFYRRTKLLHDLDTESSPISIAHSALLLSFWSPSASPGLRKPNTAWLSVAIQHAKTVEANHYASLPAATPAQVRKQNALKRLWWCCVIRDRIMGLGMRRSIQITRAHFDMDRNAMLGFADLADEVDRSRVYNPGTKRCLAEILEQLVELCVVLTDILILVFPLDDSPGWGREMRPEEQDRVRECKVALRRWYKSATLCFPLFGGDSVARMNSVGRKEFQHDSVILYTNLMYMYYHSSRVVLSHHEILHLAITAAAPNFNTVPTRDLSTICENRHELQDAASGVTECLKELIHLRLARWLPISAVACTALPLVLHILDVKLSSTSKTPSLDPNTQSALKQHRLNILIEAMKTYQPQYDGVDWVSETIRHIINIAQIDPPSESSSNNTAISDWTDILSSQPSSYLRLALTMDLALSKGRLPEDRDFPVSLRGLFTGGFNSLRMLLNSGRTEMVTNLTPIPNIDIGDIGIGSMRPSFFNIEPGTITAIPSDEETESPNSIGENGTTDETSPRTGPEYQFQDGGFYMHDGAPSEGMGDLAAEVMAAFPMDDGSMSGGSDYDAMYMDGSEQDACGEWVQNAWNDTLQVDDRADRDTAKVLLEALKDGEMSGCMA